MKYVGAGTITLVFVLSACASQHQTPAPPPLNLVTEAPVEPSATPPPTGAQLLARQPSEVQAAIKEHQQDGKWRVYRTAEYTLYPYNQEPEPIVDCAPLRTTDIQLQPGETITDVALGDTERWMATPAASGDPRNAVPHLAVKPQAPGMKTSDAPALLIAAGGGTQMVNYRVEGNYYVVDRLFNQAILVSGVGRQQDRVTIAYAGESR